MNKLKKLAEIIFILLLLTFAINAKAASEVTGNLSSGVNGSNSGSIGGTVGGGSSGSIGGTVTRGGGGGGGGGNGGGSVLGASTGGGSNNPAGQVLGASTTAPGFPTTGLGFSSYETDLLEVGGLLIALTIVYSLYPYRKRKNE